jgi:EAL domain-containing protein (putative c-di-GMP-specific phosphodiesterase class I)
LYDLSEAIKSTSQLYLVFQPKVSLRSGKTEGVEALLRWRHPQLGNISPATIVSLAEKTSLMSEITQWVIKKVIAQLKSWRSQGITLPVSINVTVSDFLVPALRMSWKIMFSMRACIRQIFALSVWRQKKFWRVKLRLKKSWIA